MKNCISSSQRQIDPMSQDGLMPPNVGSRWLEGWRDKFLPSPFFKRLQLKLKFISTKLKNTDKNF